MKGEVMHSVAVDDVKKPIGVRDKLLRTILPAVLILVWVAISGLGGPLFGRIDEVSANDQSLYLPESAAATQVQEARKDFVDSSAIPVILIFTAKEPLSAETMADLTGIVAEVSAELPLTGPGSPVLPAADGLAAQVILPLDATAEIADSVQQARQILATQTPSGVTAHVTGPAGFTADLSAAFAGIDGLLLLVALVAVFIILILVYRSLLLPVLVLLTSVFALCGALLTVWWLAKWGVFMLSGQTQGILFILVIGAATDYSLLVVARYREELLSQADVKLAIWRAVRQSMTAIFASGGTVIAGLLCLLLSDLKSNSILGPVAAAGIVFAILSALTFLPALLAVFGRAAFWPRIPRVQTVVAGEPAATSHRIWARIAIFIPRRPRRLWAITSVALLLGCAGLWQLSADGVAQSDLVLGKSDARDGLVALGEHFPAGSGSPVLLLTPEAEVAEVMETLRGNAAFSAVTAVGEAGAGAPPGVANEPKVVDGKVLLEAELVFAPDSDEALETIADLRAELPESVLVGGATAIAYDTNETSLADRQVIIPLVLLVITLILMVLLRSVLAPVLLVLTTVVSFGTALGVAALVFNHVFDFPGADPAVPLFGFVFLVALGIDYNIFLMTRVREESLKQGTRRGVLTGLEVTGGVITSAGVVLAATFLALAVIPILFLAQIAFIVAFGVLLDTFVVRTLLVPALVYDLGGRVWWPKRLKADAAEVKLVKG